MRVIEKLTSQEDNKSLEKYRMLNALDAGKYKLSIQGSCGHYCSPRITTKTEMYVSMELAIFNKKGWFQIKKSSVLRKFSRFNELLRKADDIQSSAPVFGYVPIDLINDLYIYLSSISKK